MAAKKHKEPVLAKRPSTLVGRSAVPAAIKAREELERLLRIHDPELVEGARSRIKPAQLPLVRRIALDQSPEGEGLVLRKHAIAVLGSLGAAEDLNLLADLARFDAEPGVRAEALLSLARSGVEMAAPILVEAIASSDLLEAGAASKALGILANKAGVSAVRVHMDKGTANARKLAAAVLDKLATPTKAKRVKPSETRRDPPAER